MAFHDRRRTIMNWWEQCDPPTRGEGRRRWHRLKALLVCLAMVLLIGAWLSYRYSPNRPEDFADIREHFKYGSIGSDNLENGLPVAILRILPRMFPDHLPSGGP